jgi:hypothetical protein
MKNFVIGTIAAATMVFSVAVSAHEHEGASNALVKDKLQAIAGDPAVISAVNAQNAKTGGYDQGKIDSLDKQWRAETQASAKPMIDKVLANALSQHLKGVADASEGLLTEVFVMDAKGLNVGQSAPTSDFWQGDEAKWKKTYGAGSGAVFIDKVEEDESTQSFQTQINLAVTDPASGKVIGAITFGVNAEMLLQ